MKIVPCTPELAPHFERLNRGWIETFFTIEPIDEYVLQNPYPVIIDKGGEVWFALDDAGTPIGAYALLKFSPQRYEFTKFAVDPKAQGSGAGRALLLHSIERGKALGADELLILSNTSLTRACDMYRKAGWVEQEMNDEDKARYKRVNIKLLLDLKTQAAA